MLFLWHDDPLIEAWLDARLRAELHSEHAASSDNRPLERLEVSVIEPLPDVGREPIERAAGHSLNQAAPTRYTLIVTKLPPPEA